MRKVVEVCEVHQIPWRSSIQYRIIRLRNNPTAMENLSSNINYKLY